MYVKVAYRLIDQHGYRFIKPEMYYGVTIHTVVERESGRHRDDRVVKIESRSGGGAYLFNPHFEIGCDHINVKAEGCFNHPNKFPDGVHAPVASVMQEWILKVNVQGDEEKDYDKAMKAAEAKEKKMWKPYGK